MLLKTIRNILVNQSTEGTGKPGANLISTLQFQDYKKYPILSIILMS